jgi:hypothetical protein
MEALWVAMPPGADELSLVFERPAPDAGIRIASTEATLVGAIDAGLADLRSRFDPFRWHGVASMAFRRLEEEAAAAGAPWTSLRATCRMPHTARPAVVLEGAVEIPIGEAPLKDRLFTSALAAEAAASMPAAIERQNRLRERLEGMKGWSYSQDTVTLKLELPRASQSLRSNVIGSFSAGESTFLWSWGNRSFSPEVRGDVARLKSDPALALFRRAGFFCDEDFALIAAMLAAHRLGAGAVFPARTGQTLIFMTIPS